MSQNCITLDIKPQPVIVNLNTVVTRDPAFKQDPFTGDGTTTEFELTNQFKDDSLMIFINGVLAKRGAGNTYTEGSDKQTITFIAAPAGGSYPDEILAVYAVR